LPVPAGESAGGDVLVAAGKLTNNQWFLVGSAAADLKSPEASGGDDTEK
jgi:hypothetical protein